MRCDFAGQSSAIDLFFGWLTGNGEDQTYNKESNLVKNLLKSKKMQGFIKTAIDNYRNGESITEDDAEFTRQDDGYDLYLSLQHFHYRIKVHEETRIKGFWLWKHQETRYIAEVTVTDVYNFDSLRKWNSFGNDMNNLAYIYHNVFGGGNDYAITAEYQVRTKWYKIK